MCIDRLDGNQIVVGGVAQQHGSDKAENNRIVFVPQKRRARCKGDTAAATQVAPRRLSARGNKTKVPDHAMLKILLLCNDPVTLALMRASADALKGVLDAFDDAADLQRKLNKGTNGLPVAVVLDLAALAARGIRLANACTRVRQTLPDAKIGVIASATHWVDDVIVEWAREAEPTTPSPRSTPGAGT
jgi:hypothetical protein